MTNTMTNTKLITITNEQDKEFLKNYYGQYGMTLRDYYVNCEIVINNETKECKDQIDFYEQICKILLERMNLATKNFISEHNATNIVVRSEESLKGLLDGFLDKYLSKIIDDKMEHPVINVATGVGNEYDAIRCLRLNFDKVLPDFDKIFKDKFLYKICLAK